MPKFDDHPTVKRWREQITVENRATSPAVLDADRLRKLCLDAGADDVGFVELERPAIDNQRQDILAAFPATKTLISFVCRMNRENVRTPARSIANLEFHANYDHTNDVARSIVKTLEEIGVRAMNPSAAFPMEMERFPGKVWVVSHKPRHRRLASVFDKRAELNLGVVATQDSRQWFTQISSGICQVFSQLIHCLSQFS
ncbi:4Fe-4S ferredoxin iron-sulfur binding domain protein [Scytonema sp. HK-05]|uniref:hypothetical protein n=1 Tax=Scytonema sp. HK-05 TaxID=1137095 RepID=UPI000A749073|nr:hypothetical protein [Scytonema sp. HK-05]BAY44602.1 4Fe-4S ferredoxin iron-sulfur binding domain protein [Scytonema sp. HK-05]